MQNSEIILRKEKLKVEIRHLQSYLEVIPVDNPLINKYKILLDFKIEALGQLLTSDQIKNEQKLIDLN